ncbi:hypothetical protein BIFGAL_04021 [Bifidobacterium gallicum DSM 20093 = LMG 11596]|uniref:Uncharacterized protein n=1 Tax=Bifidobacterium gallicum DSM 20093 = LMG 11596 TaxID=561180 RepID=D1NVX7_9BIFI|nr:hypothetical protein BIFGAL_04021 [Bifidobacterium gallicum DSM 20093 = LMG 11596]
MRLACRNDAALHSAANTAPGTDSGCRLIGVWRDFGMAHNPMRQTQ